MMTDRNRRSIRIKGYDYTGAGASFVTICTEKRRPLFGDVAFGKMIMNEVGDIVEEEWIRTPTIRHNVKLYVYIIMPNQEQRRRYQKNLYFKTSKNPS
jgi:putative transposase